MRDQKPVTVVLGASPHSWRYSNYAVRRLAETGHDVIAIGKEKGLIGDILIHAGATDLNDIDTVTIYLRKEKQIQYYNYLLSLRPRRIIFNPGAENVEFATKARAAGIDVVNACTLVMLSTGQY